MAFGTPGTAISRDLPRKNMGRAKSLTDSGKQIVLALLAENKSEREIAERIGCSKNAVHNVIVAIACCPFIAHCASAEAQLRENCDKELHQVLNANLRVVHYSSGIASCGETAREESGTY